MRFQPTISIILGIITAVIIFEISTLILGKTSWILTASVAAPIGGFISNYFTEVRRVIYGAIAGFVLAVIVVISGIGTYITLDTIWTLLIFYVLPVTGSAGSFFAELSDKIGMQRFERQYQSFMRRKRYIPWGIWTVVVVTSFTLLYTEVAPLHFSSSISIQHSGFSPQDDYIYELDRVTWINNDNNTSYCK